MRREPAGGYGKHHHTSQAQSPEVRSPIQPACRRCRCLLGGSRRQASLRQHGSPAAGHALRQQMLHMYSLNSTCTEG